MQSNIIDTMLNKNKSLIEEAKEQIKEVYLEDDRPWVVGYSGGKDSTVVSQIVFEALKELDSNQLHKKVYIISSDTLVETPLIIQSINTTLHRIQSEALKLGLPIETHKVKPEPEQSFWANIIGKGYPSPNQQMRWCTDRMKIDPANKFVKDKVSKFGEVIMLLGVREDESATRANVINSHTVEGKRLMKHSTLTNAYVFAPIKKFKLDDVWEYLLNNTSPWGDDNTELYKLYSDSNSGECPLVIDKTVKESAGSCGNSRFGCWTCTVVNEDKALNGFIENGEEWMRPLLEFRNWLAGIRDDRTRRMKYRMDGQIYFLNVQTEEIDEKLYAVLPKKGSRAKKVIPVDQFNLVQENELSNYLAENNIDLSAPGDDNILIEKNDGNYAQLGLGPFTMEARQEILKYLLEIQRDLNHPSDPSFELIQEEELRIIRRYWLEKGDWEDKLPEIYQEVMGYDLDWDFDDQPLFDREQITDLEILCERNNIDFKLVQKLIGIEKNYSGYKIKRGIYEEIEKALTQDYLHI
ncbi:DNA phosphorothioation system sulfurtransferase DndC [Allobacillus sp. GCM10007491]|uniref:DNA phosphorothioation system sulfurtransferase DndC n=1 Tax=Allobacillus saliphilus TaxID=2912308 RepID=A0A941HTU2_9BACI|nr:DNA phosphorothioation system sulfurtransferase DndC [Allobacillus saliphilus]MBR7553629.1 DNA phosphorothioation system sulfurtransferase DndC [Allobacillus saliphilus]